MKTVEDIRQIFVEKYKNNDFVFANGKKTIEIVGENFIADENTIFCPINQDYIDRELQWYLSKSLNVYDIPGKIPEIWKQVADKDGFINSNYGWCIFSEENGSQYRNSLRQLINDRDTRRAVMIYTRPSMQYDYNKNGMSDFMCTCYTHQFIRNNKLVYIVYQRSCDAIFGFRNDLAWHQYVAYRLVKDLNNNFKKEEQIDLKPEIIFSCGSIHVYDKQFPHIEKYMHRNDEDSETGIDIGK